MMHGTQKLELTHESVKEALQDYLRKHVADNVEVSVKKWAPKASNAPVPYGQEPPGSSVEIEFEQAEKSES